MQYVQTHWYDPVVRDWNAVEVMPYTPSEVIEAVPYPIVEFDDAGTARFLDVTLHRDVFVGDVTLLENLDPDVLLTELAINTENYDLGKYLDFATGPYNSVIDDDDVVVTGWECRDALSIVQGALLATVNGMLTQSRVVWDTLVVRGAGGVLSKRHTSALGGVFLPGKYVSPLIITDITSTEMTKLGPVLDDGISITAPEVPPEHIPFMVFGGYLIPLGEAFEILDPVTFKLNLEKVPYVEWMTDKIEFLVPGEPVVAEPDSTYLEAVFDTPFTYLVYMKADELKFYRSPVRRENFKVKGGGGIIAPCVSQQQDLFPLVNPMGGIVDYGTALGADPTGPYRLIYKERRYATAPVYEAFIQPNQFPDGRDPFGLTVKPDNLFIMSR